MTHHSVRCPGLIFGVLVYARDTYTHIQLEPLKRERMTEFNCLTIPVKD